VDASALAGAPDARGTTCAARSLWRLRRLNALSRVGQLPAELRSAIGRLAPRFRGQPSLLPRGAGSRESDPSQSAPLEDSGSQDTLPKEDVPSTCRARRSCTPRAIPSTLEGGDDYVSSQVQVGESLSARREELQKAQLLPRGVTYNLHRLVLLLGLLRVQARLERHALSPAGGGV
jgi:hypothetical protein